MKMGRRHCILNQMPHMNISTTVKLMIVKIIGQLKNARKSATRTSARITIVVRTIVRKLVTNVTENRSHSDNITHKKRVFLLVSTFELHY